VAHAQRDLTAPQSDAWYGTHAATLGSLTVANVATMALWHPAEARFDSAFGWERRTEQNHAPVTSRISDVTLHTSVAAPLVTLASRSRVSWGNALMVYGEAVQGSLLLNTVTKKSVARARPYTHNPQASSLVEAKGADAHYSFYSGHSALSFSGATAGSYLFAALHEETGARAAHWASALALASFTAHARVRAGRHYPTDVLVGSVMGASWGLAVPLLHGIRPEIRPVELVAAGGGVATGAVLALTLPRRMRDDLAALDPSLVPVAGGAVFRMRLALPGAPRLGQCSTPRD
jgi:hypothetical protein